MVASQGSGLECTQNVENPAAYDTEVAMPEAVNERFHSIPWIVIVMVK
jgi:hypothetical protein